MKKLQNLFIAAGIMLLLFSCKDNEPEPKQEVYNFPTKLFPVKVSYISNARFFIAGEEIFDTVARNTFIRGEWLDQYFPGPRFDFFDKSNFLNNRFIPDSINFQSKDTAILGYGSYSVEWNKPYFVFHRVSPYYLQSSILKTKNFTIKTDNIYQIHSYTIDYQNKLLNYIDDFREKLNTKPTAQGDYNELEYDKVNYRYYRDKNDIPLWTDAGTMTYGITGRDSGNFNYEDIISSMHPKDTFVFQQYQIKYKIR